MKRLFISQPMNGKPDEEIIMKRKAAIQRAREAVGEEVEVIDNFYFDFSDNAKPLEYLARSIADLAKADVAYFVKGWEKKRGCQIEHLCAVEYGIDCIEEHLCGVDNVCPHCGAKMDRGDQ